MKKCTYCGRENEDEAIQCSGCFQDDRFESDSPSEATKVDNQDDFLTLISCAKLTDADLVVSRLESAGIETFIPDQHLMQAIGFNLNTYGYVRVQVRRKDYADAKELLAPPETASAKSPSPASGGLKIIAALEVGQTDEILDRLKKRAIPAVMRPVTDESGLEMSQILVEDSYYDRGCDVVEAWNEEQIAEAQKHSNIFCRSCGSRNYDRTWDEKIGDIYKCKDCGQIFVK